ncbi:hypothetical protein BGZ61DRAFT_593301 [Ilyonectria robusta]|uniref:uncharacterized protein n=1 Tax=Ilyonectria robusta TaxID=1079257 RepID=UPI001E8E46DA|nr:uncharacterized protein BGZ61DRAFT_593301 [Ilyonectria robusta]KAH8663768.1 hypothetical protein BGZ61DRAFT_593301 [Ilyonectria robusta]
MAAVSVALNNAQWEPENEGESQLKTALENVLISSPSSVITKAPDNKTNRFILQTQGYHDLYLYVVEGITFTDSTAEFEKQFTKSTFAVVDKIDISAYDLLRDTTVSVAKHCKEFNSNGLGKLTTSANGAIAYADHCIGLMKEKADISLYNAFQVLLDEKYVTQPKDNAFEEAVESATLAFYTQTDGDVKKVGTIEEKFLTGPKDPVTGQRKVKSDGTLQEPYSEVMDAEVARLQTEITNSITRRDEENDKWATARDKAIGLGVGGVFLVWLWIGSGVETDKAIKAKNKYDEMVTLITKDSQDKADLVKVLELVRALVNHFHALLPKMQTALTAMKELQNLFNEQNLNFQLILNKLTDLQTGVSAKGQRARKNWITTAIDEAVEKFKEIKDLGEEFKRGATPVIEQL